MMTQEAERIENVSQIKPNTIVQYEGGGYDGCFWEYNYAYIDRNGKFHDVASSGRKGCKTRKELQAAIAEANAKAKRSLPDRLDFYHLGDPEEIARFGRETPISHLLGMAKWFHKHEIDTKLTVVCDCCGRTVEVYECEGEGIKGIGGIAMQYQKIICAVCEEEGTCRYCGSYVGKECIDENTGYCTGKNDGGWTGCHEKHGDEE